MGGERHLGNQEEPIPDPGSKAQPDPGDPARLKLQGGFLRLSPLQESSSQEIILGSKEEQLGVGLEEG